MIAREGSLRSEEVNKHDMLQKAFSIRESRRTCIHKKTESSAQPMKRHDKWWKAGNATWNERARMDSAKNCGFFNNTIRRPQSSAEHFHSKNWRTSRDPLGRLNDRNQRGRRTEISFGIWNYKKTLPVTDVAQSPRKLLPERTRNTSESASNDDWGTVLNYYSQTANATGMKWPGTTDTAGPEILGNVWSFEVSIANFRGFAKHSIAKNAFDRRYLNAWAEHFSYVYVDNQICRKVKLQLL